MGEGGRRLEHRRYDLGQGHGDRREGPREPVPQGRPEGNEQQEVIGILKPLHPGKPGLSGFLYFRLSINPAEG